MLISRKSHSGEKPASINCCFIIFGKIRRLHFFSFARHKCHHGKRIDAPSRRQLYGLHEHSHLPSSARRQPRRSHCERGNPASSRRSSEPSTLFLNKQNVNPLFALSSASDGYNKDSPSKWGAGGRACQGAADATAHRFAPGQCGHCNAVIAAWGQGGHGDQGYVHGVAHCRKGGTGRGKKSHGEEDRRSHRQC